MRVASSRSVRGVAVGGSVVGSLAEGRVDLCVAAEVREKAAGAALLSRAIVKGDVLTVVALLGGHLPNCVTAVGRQGAVCIAAAVRAGVLGGAEVASLVGRDDSVAANADAGALARQEVRESEPVVRFRRVAFRLKYGHLVNVALGQRELSVRHHVGTQR